MMHFSSVSEIIEKKEADSEASVRGWLHHRRSSGGLLFLQVRDGSGVIQCTVRKDAVGGEKFAEAEKLTLESTLAVTGKVRKDPRAPGGSEIAVENIQVFAPAQEDYPIARKYHGPDFLLDYRHLHLRNEKMQAIMRVRAAVISEARRWLVERGYLEVHVPTIVTTAVEGGATLFEVKYFDQKAYLNQSWQFYAEALIASVGKIFTLAPSFRAEKSRTRRHLTEYWHLEVEEPWLELDGLLKLEEELVSYTCNRVSDTMKKDLALLGRDPSELASIRPPFKRITYDEMVKILKEEGVQFEWGMDAGADEEKVVSGRFKAPFFVTHFPKKVKAFYHMPDQKRSDVTLSADMLAPEGYGEITGGGQRIHDYEQLLARIREEGLSAKEYDWYLDLRRYGTLPHSGFGMGIERTVAWICKLQHIRDAIAFPRLINRVYP